LGATSARLDLSGGAIPMRNWYAPSLAAPAEAGVQDWSTQEIVQLLQSGVAPRGAAMGPMADVVAGSTQHLAAADLHAMAAFLRELPRQPAMQRPGPQAGADVLSLGKRIYGERCAQCHGDQGQGGATAYPALAGHRSVTMGGGENLVRVILSGGFPATTAGNPRPYGMPPFAQALGDAEIAAVASFVRSAWGNDAAAVRPLDVQKLR
jgi:mono/diheme cytochrome c family protein